MPGLSDSKFVPFEVLKSLQMKLYEAWGVFQNNTEVWGKVGQVRMKQG